MIDASRAFTRATRGFDSFDDNTSARTREARLKVSLGVQPCADACLYRLALRPDLDRARILDLAKGAPITTCWLADSALIQQPAANPRSFLSLSISRPSHQNLKLLPRVYW